MAEPSEPAESSEVVPSEGDEVGSPPKSTDRTVGQRRAPPEPAFDVSPGAMRYPKGGTLAWSDGPTTEEVHPGTPSGKNVPWPRLARVDIQPPGREPTPVTAKTSGHLSQTWLWVAAQVCGFGLLLGGYFLGQTLAPRPRPQAALARRASGIDETTKPVRTSGEQALESANRALRAERERNFKSARAIYEETASLRIPLPGAEYRLALISLHEGDYPQTEIHLDRSLREGDSMVDCYLLRASLAGMKSNYAEASLHLAAAARSQPFNAKLLFCWGEALRRAGRMVEALDRLAQALDRPDNAVARKLYLFKWRLAKVEAGHDEIFDADLARHVVEPSPGGDWLLLAAAQEIGRKNYAEAAKRLDRAKLSLPPEMFATILQDYLFQAQRSRPELVASINAPSADPGPPGAAPLEDPATWTAAEADPATWPPFSKAE